MRRPEEPDYIMNGPATPNRTGSMSEQVVRAVADYRGVDPQELDESLYTAIDPEALDVLFARNPDESSVVKLTFRYDGHQVTVRKDRTITVRDDH